MGIAEMTVAIETRPRCAGRGAPGPRVARGLTRAVQAPVRHCRSVLLYCTRLLPSRVDQRVLVRAHVEAYDHLAMVTDGPGGTLDVSGPVSLRVEIDAMLSDVCRATGVLRVSIPL